ncbi:GerAB/ArcD/ProY family transporter [Paenibacillus polymyxa]|uniref:GerAB/ArcD/ProY family transporter n=1 Tax=Paenibacillus polymyxa TaxID=1406 RepID=UPI0025B63167|nr:GerAB/ArcD/ProY family transporter [Paenibacillus polymyxa]MDN4081710.1 GerAB/ArcD/ProY family transporter [Paenibacillus polymyxa]MDN4089059.1 GerAB/ArcD/ProY family transporter [Paenibacillus polymyxa]MDN4109435.1 GerAB/ArcD/ProY family transporter [Paenibacillus polymyxa]
MSHRLANKTYISTGQMLILMFHFILGNAVIINMDSEYERNTWIAQTIAMLVGMVLFRMYTYTAERFPGQMLTTYARQLVGNKGGTAIGVLYILFFLYLTSRNLRDETELVRVSVLEKTPSLVVAFLMILCAIYVLWLGFEVLARTGQVFFVVILIVMLLGNTLLLLSGSVHLEELMPVMSKGFKPVLMSALRDRLAFPFGELICFMMFVPSVKRPSQITKAGYISILAGGTILVEVAILNVTVLGTDITERSIFPLLSTFQNVQLSEYVQRPDVIVLMSIIIGDFFKVALFSYAAVLGISDIFGLPYRKVLLPCGIIVLLWSQVGATNLSEHFEFGRLSLIYVHPLFVYVIPCLFFLLALLRRSRGRS